MKKKKWLMAVVILAVLVSALLYTLLMGHQADTDYNEASTNDAETDEPFNIISFEDGKANGFVGRAGSEVVSVTDKENHTEDGKHALMVEGRAVDWHGPTLRVEKYIEQGSEYKVVAWVKLIDPARATIQLSTQIGDGDEASYINLSSITANANDWVKLEGTYRYNNLSSGYVTIYFETIDNPAASFYIDDVQLEKTPSQAVEVQEDLKPIKDVYEDDFLIGNAISFQTLQGIRFDMLKMHYNSATAENAMKPGELQPEKGQFKFSLADKLVDAMLDVGIKVHGHTLVWHQQSPDWMNTFIDNEGNKVYLSRDEALENMRTHTKTVVEHFGDRVISWDVVNEAMNDNPPNPANWRASLRQSPWYHAIGDDYIEQAFLAAREVLDSHPDWDVKLYYNDYNDDNQNKSKAIYNMVKEINEKYQQEHPGKLLIDGVGMQAHYSINTNPKNVALSLERFIELGVEISVAELDIRAGENHKLTDKLAKEQGYLYAQLFELYKENADHIARITFWGMDDGTSWRAVNTPLLFDSNQQAKPAYYGVIDPTEFILEYSLDEADIR